jgi:hypothetical protein
MALKDRLYNPVGSKLLPTVTKYSYPWMTRRLAGHDVILMNNGYEEDPRWGWSWTTPTNPADSPSSSTTPQPPKQVTSLASECGRSVAATAAAPPTSPAPTIPPPTPGWT